MQSDETGRFRVHCLAAGLTLAACSLVAGAAPACPRSAADANNPLPGRKFEVDGHQMYIDCDGTANRDDSATVVFDSGLGDSSLVWSRVQPEIARVTRACSYDRSGYGESDARLPPRTSAVIVDELHDLLVAAEVTPPYILVGHSFGGWNMQLFASTYPDSVAAMVLVDSSQIDQIERYRQDLGVNIAPQGDFHLNTTPFVPPNLPTAKKKRAESQTYNPVTWRTAHHELLRFRTSEHQVAAARPLPAVPIILLSRGRAIDADSASEDTTRRERLWRALQQEFVDNHPGTVHWVAHHSGHYIQLQQPQLVVRSICRALREARAAGARCNALTPRPRAARTARVSSSRAEPASKH